MMKTTYEGIARRADASMRALSGRAPAHVQVAWEHRAAVQCSPCGDIDSVYDIWARTDRAGIGGGRAALAYGRVAIHRTVSGSWVTDAVSEDARSAEWAVLVSHPDRVGGADVFTGQRVLSGLKQILMCAIADRALNADFGDDGARLPCPDLSKRPEWLPEIPESGYPYSMGGDYLPAGCESLPPDPADYIHIRPALPDDPAIVWFVWWID